MLPLANDIGVTRETADGPSSLANHKCMGSSRRLCGWAPVSGDYLVGLKTTSCRVWSWVMRFWILVTNFGVKPFTICRMPGPNSW
jgi:hypothetical protein